MIRLGDGLKLRLQIINHTVLVKYADYIDYLMYNKVGE